MENGIYKEVVTLSIHNTPCPELTQISAKKIITIVFVFIIRYA